MKEKFREIYETNLTVKKGQNKIKEWLNHAQVFFRESASTIKNHLREFATTFLIAPQVDLWEHPGFAKTSNGQEVVEVSTTKF